MALWWPREAASSIRHMATHCAPHPAHRHTSSPRHRESHAAIGRQGGAGNVKGSSKIKQLLIMLGFAWQHDSHQKTTFGATSCHSELEVCLKHRPYSLAFPRGGYLRSPLTGAFTFYFCFLHTTHFRSHRVWFEVWVFFFHFLKIIVWSWMCARISLQRFLL